MELNEICIPHYMYSYQLNTSTLCRTELATGNISSFPLCGYYFRFGSVWCEGPRSCLYFSGGNKNHQLDCIDAAKEYAVTSKAPMCFARSSHASICHGEFLYVFGGFNHPNDLRECERFAIQKGRWETLMNLPQSCGNVSVVCFEETQCFYVIGGCFEFKAQDHVQRFDLGSLCWQALDIKLPYPAFGIPLFKVTVSQALFVLGNALYSLNPSSGINHIKDLGKSTVSYGPSYFFGGILYCSNSTSVGLRLFIGDLP